jgi:SOS-response transcriptional repressor LexA
MAQFTVGRTQQPSSSSANVHSSSSSAPRDILEAIAQLTADQGRPPTRRELLSHTGITSHRHVTEVVTALVRDGRLRRLPGARGLIVLPPLPVRE